MEKSPNTISIGFMLDAAIANAGKARRLRSHETPDDLYLALKAVEDAFDAAAEKLRAAITISEKQTA